MYYTENKGLTLKTVGELRYPGKVSSSSSTSDKSHFTKMEI